MVEVRQQKQNVFPCSTLSCPFAWRDMLDRYSPGTEYETEYLSRKHLEEHKELKQVAVYSEGEIKEF